MQTEANQFETFSGPPSMIQIRDRDIGYSQGPGGSDLSLAENGKVVTDLFGRTMRKLRVQLTDFCQLRCFYCMPDNPTFLAKDALLPPQKIVGIVRTLRGFGLEEVRVTGGEPTARPDFHEIMVLLSDIPIRKFGLTTNGVFLKRTLHRLAQETTLQSINLSLDTLRAERFASITKQHAFARVMDNLLLARDLGFQVKVNTVVFRDINADEIMDFVRFAEQESIEVRFLEYMRVGPQSEDFRKHYFPARNMLEHIRAERELVPIEVESDSTSFCFQTRGGAGQSGRIGFIASESQPFCSKCSRLRLSAEGILRACLFKEEGLSLRHASEEEYAYLIGQVVAMKPGGRPLKINQAMNQIGG